MVPLVKTTVHRLLNEPVVALGLIAEVGVIVNEQLPLPTWSQALALALFTFATRSVVTGPLTEK